MATITKEKCRVAYTISGNSPETQWFYESAGKSFKAGAALFFSGSKRLLQFPTATGLSRPDLGTSGIVGIAMQDAGSYTNSTTLVPVAVANDDTVFIANLAARQ